jgi:hypothetical protein
MNINTPKENRNGIALLIFGAIFAALFFIPVLMSNHKDNMASKKQKNKTGVIAKTYDLTHYQTKYEQQVQYYKNLSCKLDNQINVVKQDLAKLNVKSSEDVKSKDQMFLAEELAEALTNKKIVNQKIQEYESFLIQINSLSRRLEINQDLNMETDKEVPLLIAKLKEQQDSDIFPIEEDMNIQEAVDFAMKEN